MNVNCPTCQKQHVWSSDNPFRPFCCERCKLIDLGEWAAENQRFPGELALDALESMDDEQLANLMAGITANKDD